MFYLAGFGVCEQSGEVGTRAGSKEGSGGGVVVHTTGSGGDSSEGNGSCRRGV